MYYTWTSKAEKEIQNLMNTIQDAAFKDGKMIQLELPDIEFENGPFEDGPDKLSFFLEEYASILWHHKQAMEPEEKLFWKKELEKHIQEILKEERNYLRNERGYSTRTVNEVCKLLDADLKSRVENYPKSSDGKRHLFPEDTPESRSWIEQENKAISKIRKLYLKYSPLKNDRQIANSMSLVLKPVHFWPHERNGPKGNLIDRYHDRIISRFKKIKKAT